jgi:hypothetical protein
VRREVPGRGDQSRKNREVTAVGPLRLRASRLNEARALPMPQTARSPKSHPIVPRRVKDFIEISDYTSLEDLIRYLQSIRDNLPAEHQAELKIRGDDVFGRRLTITYFREQTPEEVELEAKYAGASGAEIESLRRRLDAVDFPKKQKS